MKLTTIRRWGQHDAGTEIEVTDTEGQWLLANHYASEDGSTDRATAGSFAPGTHGADLRAGGDLTRPGGPQFARGGKGDSRRGDDNGLDDSPNNRAGRINGAPKPGGSVYLTPHEVEAKREQAELAERHRREVAKADANGEPRPALDSKAARDASGKSAGDGNDATPAARRGETEGKAAGKDGKSAGK